MLTVIKRRNHNPTIVLWKGGMTVARMNLTSTMRGGPVVVPMLVSGVLQGGILGPERMVSSADEARDKVDGGPGTIDQQANASTKEL